MLYKTLDGETKILLWDLQCVISVTFLCLYLVLRMLDLFSVLI